MANAFYRTLGSPWVWGFAYRYLMPLWFGLHAAMLLLGLTREPGGLLGIDARIYYRAAASWLHGGDPWSSGADGYLFAAPPPTLIAVAPFVAIGESATMAIWIGVSLVLAIWTLRRLKLPIWWLAFPPIVEAIWVGNFNVVVLALLALGRPWADGLAGLLKIYAAVPAALLFRRRGLVVLAILVFASAPVLPWFEYLQQAGAVSKTLAEQSGGGRSAWAHPLLVAPVAVALWSLGRERAAWLAIPALWPATQAHYVLLALPVLHPGVAALVATGFPGMVSLGIIGWAVADRLREMRRLRLAGSVADGLP